MTLDNFILPQKDLAKIKGVTKKLAIKIPNWRVIDIDNEIDWNRAEIMYRFIQNNKNLLKFL